MTIKEFLEQGLFLDLEIKTKKVEIAKLDLLIREAEKGEAENKEVLIEELKGAIEEFSDVLIRDITRLVYIKHEIVTKINAVEDGRSRVLLSLRYLEFKTWEQIAEEMEYSSMQVQRIHKNILKGME